MRGEFKILLSVLKNISGIILENGGGTHRAEETVCKICEAFGYDVDILALPTGTFLTVSDKDGNDHSVVTRIKKRTINLNKVDMANEVSRKLVKGELSLIEADNQLKEIKVLKNTNRLFLIVSAGLAAAFFAVLFGGSLFDFFAAMVCGMIIEYVVVSFKRIDLFHFLISMLGGIIAAALAIALTVLFGMGNIDKIIIGAIMSLLPGLALTNSIIDTMNGDLVSGVSRLGEVILVAIALASGVGIILALYISFGGNPTFLQQSASVNILMHFAVCFIASVCFAYTMAAPKKAIFYSAVIAALGFVIFDVSLYFKLNILAATFLATLFIALAGEIGSRVLKKPAILFIFPAVIPLVPGIGLYQSMLYLVQNDFGNFSKKGTETVLIAILMAAAIAVVNILIRVIKYRSVKQ